MPRATAAILVIAALTTAAAEGRPNQWIMEQVTASGGWKWAELVASPEGQLHILHVTRDNVVYHSWMDTVWLSEEAARLGNVLSYDFAVGPNGHLGFIVDTGSYHPVLFLHTESGWTGQTVPVTLSGRRIRLSFNNTASPAMVFEAPLVTGMRPLHYAELVDTAWAVDTFSPAGWNMSQYCNGLVHDASGRAAALTYWWQGSEGTDASPLVTSDISYSYTDLHIRLGPRSWQRLTLAGGVWHTTSPLAIAPVPDSGVGCLHSDYVSPGPTQLMMSGVSVPRVILDNTPSAAVLAFDSLRRMHAVLAEPFPRYFLYDGSTLRQDTVTAMPGFRVTGIGVTKHNEPRVGLLSPDSTVWVARPMPVGTADAQVGAPLRTTSGWDLSDLGRTDQPCFVYGVTGRAVQTGGASRTRPSRGVYFVRYRDGSPCRKVVLVR